MIKMNKVVASILATLAIGAVAYAGGSKGGMATVQSASTNVTAVILPQDGQIAVTSANYWQPTASATLKKYLGSDMSRVGDDVSASTTVYMLTDNTLTNGAAPTLHGYTLTANDYVIIPDTTASSTTRPQLRSLVSVGTNSIVVTNAVSGNKCWTKLVLGANATTKSNAPIYLVKSGDIISQTVTGNKEYAPAFAIGYEKMPVAFTLLTTNPGTNVEFSCTYEVW